MGLNGAAESANDQLFSRLFDNMYSAAVLIDPQAGKFLAVNHAAETMLGYTGAELRKLSPTDIHPHEIPRFEAFAGKVLKLGNYSAVDLSCRRKDGNVLPAELRAFSVHIDGRQAILVVIRDLREHSLAELGTSVRKLTHDLKNTLTTAQLMCDRLAGHSDDRVRMSADVITRAIERAVALCHQTVQAGRASEPEPDRERFLLDDVLDEIAATVVGAGGGDVRINDNSPKPVMLDADFDQVYRILLNLIRNAFDAGARLVDIDGSSQSDEAVLLIADNGPGLPESVQANLRAEKQALSDTGSGLGLMIASELCRNHGGSLDVAKSGRKGTTFRVTLPYGAI